MCPHSNSPTAEPARCSQCVLGGIAVPRCALPGPRTLSPEERARLDRIVYGSILRPAKHAAAKKRAARRIVVDHAARASASRAGATMRWARKIDLARPTPDHVTALEVERAMGVSVDGAIRRGEIATIRADRFSFVRRADVERWFAERDRKHHKRRADPAAQHREPARGNSLDEEAA